MSQSVLYSMHPIRASVLADVASAESKSSGGCLKCSQNVNAEPPKLQKELPNAKSQINLATPWVAEAECRETENLACIKIVPTKTLKSNLENPSDLELECHETLNLGERAVLGGQRTVFPKHNLSSPCKLETGCQNFYSRSDTRVAPFKCIFMLIEQHRFL